MKFNHNGGPTQLSFTRQIQTRLEQTLPALTWPVLTQPDQTCPDLTWHLVLDCRKEAAARPWISLHDATIKCPQRWTNSLVNQTLLLSSQFETQSVQLHHQLRSETVWNGPCRQTTLCMFLKRESFSTVYRGKTEFKQRIEKWIIHAFNF